MPGTCPSLHPVRRKEVWRAAKVSNAQSKSTARAESLFAAIATMCITQQLSMVSLTKTLRQRHQPHANMPPVCGPCVHGLLPRVVVLEVYRAIVASVQHVQAQAMLP